MNAECIKCRKSKQKQLALYEEVASEIPHSTQWLRDEYDINKEKKCVQCYIEWRVKQEQIKEKLKTQRKTKFQFTPEMLHVLFWRMLRDVGGVSVKKSFFEKAPKDLKWNAQYDEIKEVWTFTVVEPEPLIPVMIEAENHG